MKALQIEKKHYIVDHYQ